MNLRSFHLVLLQTLAFLLLAKLSGCNDKNDPPKPPQIISTPTGTSYLLGSISGESHWSVDGIVWTKIWDIEPLLTPATGPFVYQNNVLHSFVAQFYLASADGGAAWNITEPPSNSGGFAAIKATGNSIILYTPTLKRFVFNTNGSFWQVFELVDQTLNPLFFAATSTQYIAMEGGNTTRVIRQVSNGFATSNTSINLNIRSLHASAGVFYIVPKDTSGFLHTSPDGITWSNQTYTYTPTIALSDSSDTTLKLTVVDAFLERGYTGLVVREAYSFSGANFFRYALAERVTPSSPWEYKAIIPPGAFFPTNWNIMFYNFKLRYFMRFPVNGIPVWHYSSNLTNWTALPSSLGFGTVYRE